MESTCTHDGCTRPVYAKTLCTTHYQKARVAGTLPESPVKNLPCAHCGQPMVGRKTTRAKFCSPKCKEDARSELDKIERRIRNLGRTCEWCGVPLPEDAPANALTCSAKCGYSRSNHISGRSAARREARRAEWDANRPDCVGCGVRIPDDRRVGVKFCSPECKKRTQDARWRERSPGYMRQYIYGLSHEQFVAMLDEQDNACAICRSTEWPGKGNRPHVDHDHATGEVRGLLCGRCNFGLGQFQDDPARLAAAIKYLTR